MIVGGLIGLGMIVLGLSFFNFLVYMGLYKVMVDGFKEVWFEVILLIGIGGVFCVFGLLKIMDYIFLKVYSKLFYFILGVVFVLMIMIIFIDYVGLGVVGVLVCFVFFVVGIVLGWWMSCLEE